VKPGFALLNICLAPLVEIWTVIHLRSRLHLQLFELVREDFYFWLLVFFLSIELVRNCFSALFNCYLVHLVALLNTLCRLLLAGSTSPRLLICNLLADDHSLFKCFNPLSVFRFFPFIRTWCLNFWGLSWGTWGRALSLGDVGKRLILESTAVICCHVCYAYAGTLFKDLLLRTRLMSQGQIGPNWRRNMASCRLQLRTLQHLVNS